MDARTKHQQYLAMLKKPYTKLCRLRFLNADGSTAYSLDNNASNRRSRYFITDGNISVNLQNGQRRTASVTIDNSNGDFSYELNKLWFGTEIALDEGLLFDGGEEYYIQQGVFLIENPTQTLQPANRNITLNLVDKWSKLDGSLGGNLESTYIVDAGTNIYEPIAALLSEDSGNGYPIDRVTPIFTEYYNGKTQALPSGGIANLTDTPYQAEITGTKADVVLKMAEMVNAWVGYDAMGALRFDPSQDDILDGNKPILWRFSLDEAELIGATYNAKNTEVYNDYIVIGAQLSNYVQPNGRAINVDPSSPTNINIIGRKTYREEKSDYATDTQCQDYAEWKLKRAAVLKSEVSIECKQMFHIEENGIVTIARTDKHGAPIERHLVTGFSRSLASSASMTINAVSVNDFPIATKSSWPQ